MTSPRRFMQTGASFSQGNLLRETERGRVNTAAVITPVDTSRMITVASALISGETPSFTFEKISIGRVVAPGPETKLAITTSSSDRVKASSQPEISAGVID